MPPAPGREICLLRCPRREGRETCHHEDSRERPDQGRDDATPTCRSHRACPFPRVSATAGADELAIARDPASPTNRPLTAGAFCLKRALFLDPSRWSRKG